MAHDVIVRYTATGKGGASVGQRGDPRRRGTGFAGPDTAWDFYGPLPAGTSLVGTTSCGEAGTQITIDAFDIPTAPTSFSGASTPSSGGSSLKFRVPGLAEYVVDMTVVQGEIAVRPRDLRDPFPSGLSGVQRVNLGPVSRGDHVLEVHAVSRPGVADVQARWTIALRALPITPQLDIEQTAVKPGAKVAGSYAVNGDTTVTATVVDNSDQVIRTLLPANAVGKGMGNVSWDGRDSAGLLARSGRYRIVLSTSDPSGERNSAEHRFVVDGVRPRIRLEAGNRLGRRGRIVVHLADSWSGIAWAALNVDGRRVALVDGYDPPIRYRPRAGWKRGTHTAAVLAVDAAGNTAKATARFRVP